MATSRGSKFAFGYGLRVPQFPSMKARALLAILHREPLRYVVDRRSGSHATLKSLAGYPDLHLAFHDNQTLPPGLVRKILVKDVLLSEAEALALL
jgi:predicted RNA binding protein YcfA (HicA-like mRNA interferase family)